MPGRKERSQLIGEGLREIAILVIVLYPLDAYMEGKLSYLVCAIALVFAGVLFWCGMILEGSDE